MKMKRYIQCSAVLLLSLFSGVYGMEPGEKGKSKLKVGEVELKKNDEQNKDNASGNKSGKNAGKSKDDFELNLDVQDKDKGKKKSDTPPADSSGKSDPSPSSSNSGSSSGSSSQFSPQSSSSSGQLPAHSSNKSENTLNPSSSNSTSYSSSSSSSSGQSKANTEGRKQHGGESRPSGSFDKYDPVGEVSFLRSGLKLQVYKEKNPLKQSGLDLSSGGGDESDAEDEGDTKKEDEANHCIINMADILRSVIGDSGGTTGCCIPPQFFPVQVFLSQGKGFWMSEENVATLTAFVARNSRQLSREKQVIEHIQAPPVQLVQHDRSLLLRFFPEGMYDDALQDDLGNIYVPYGQRQWWIECSKKYSGGGVFCASVVYIIAAALGADFSDIPVVKAIPERYRYLGSIIVGSAGALAYRSSSTWLNTVKWVETEPMKGSAMLPADALKKMALAADASLSTSAKQTRRTIGIRKMQQPGQSKRS